MHSVLAVTASKGVLSAATWLAVHVADVTGIKARLATAERVTEKTDPGVLIPS